MDQLELCSVYLLSGGVSRMGYLKVWTKDRPTTCSCLFQVQSSRPASQPAQSNIPVCFH